MSTEYSWATFPVKLLPRWAPCNRSVTQPILLKVMRWNEGLHVEFTLRKKWERASSVVNGDMTIFARGNITRLALRLNSMA